MSWLRVGAVASLVSFVLAWGAGAAQLKITDVKAYAFLEHAGKLSDDLVNSGESLVDAPKGGALGGDSYEMVHKKSIHGALRLYLDFINMFQAILMLTGSQRNS